MGGLALSFMSGPSSDGGVCGAVCNDNKNLTGGIKRGSEK